MLTLAEIRDKPTVIQKAAISKHVDGVHESCMRAYFIVMRVRRLLIEKVPPKVILELMEEMDGVQAYSPEE